MPILLFATSKEMDELDSRNTEQICALVCATFGYKAPATIAACAQHFFDQQRPFDSRDKAVHRNLYRETQHAFNVLFASWVRR